MKTPSLGDRFVKVRAFLTDQGFGYAHWQARQFAAPDDATPAVLVICQDKTEQAEYLAFVEALAAALSHDDPRR